MTIKNRVSLVILRYLRYFARLELRKNKGAVLIAITGSAGKTTTRVALAAILRHKGKVKSSIHANSESGISLNILGLEAHDYTPIDWVRLMLRAPLQLIFHWEKFDYYIAEFGIDSPDIPKNMDFLLGIFRPHVAIVLNAGLAHGAAFEHLVADRNPVRRQLKVMEAIAAEKMKLARAVAPDGIAVVNYDQKELRLAMNQIQARRITFGKSKNAQFRLLTTTSSKFFTADYAYQSQKYHLHTAGPLEPASAYSLGMAIAAAAGLGVPPDRSVEYLREYASPRGRFRMFAGINKTHIIDSSYNASPETMRAALRFLAAAAGHETKVALVGDMRELGSLTKTAHKQLADWIMKYADECILFGPLTGEFTLPVLEQAGFPVRHFLRIDDLNAYLRNQIPVKAWVLVKGSQNQILLERAVENLLADKSERKHLARRGRYWDRVRLRTP